MANLLVTLSFLVAAGHGAVLAPVPIPTVTPFSISIIGLSVSIGTGSGPLGPVATNILSTLTVPVPSPGLPFTTTIPGCGTSVAPFVVVGIPTGTFFPGTTTIYLPPQAAPTQTTIVDPASNATEVIIATPLAGTCEAFVFPSPTTGSGAPTNTNLSPTATNTANCPLTGCSADVNALAQEIIDAINSLTFASQDLLTAARQIFGSSSSRRDVAVARAADTSPLVIVVSGLRSITVNLGTAIARISVLPPFPPGCDSDTIVIALIDFVRVHQALLNVLIGRAGLLSSSIFSSSSGSSSSSAADLAALEKLRLAGASTDESGFFDPVGDIMAGVLRALESVVDQLAFALIGLRVFERVE